MDPGFAQDNPGFAQIHALRVTYTYIWDSFRENFVRFLPMHIEHFLHIKRQGKNTFSPLRKGHDLAAFTMVSILVDVQGVIRWYVSIRLILA